MLWVMITFGLSSMTIAFRVAYYIFKLSSSLRARIPDDNIQPSQEINSGGSAMLGGVGLSTIQEYLPTCQCDGKLHIITFRFPFRRRL